MKADSNNESKNKILMAALQVIRSKGYASTTVDDVCREAGVTKGSFFHHFASKEEMTLAAIELWNWMSADFFARAPYHLPADPVDRLVGYVQFRSQIVSGSAPDFTCFLGTLVQETYETHPRIRVACETGLAAHIAEITRDVEAAKAMYAPEAAWSPISVSCFIQSVLQGSFIFAKANQDPTVVRANLSHLKSYLEFLFCDIHPIEGEPV